MTTRSTWHKLVERVALVLKAIAANPGNATTLWVRSADGKLMFGDYPVASESSGGVAAVTAIVQDGSICTIDASVNPLGFYVQRDAPSQLSFVNFPVGETRLVVFQGSYAIDGTTGTDPAHSYYWEGGTAPAGGGDYQFVRFLKVASDRIVCMTALNLLPDAGGS